MKYSLFLWLVLYHFIVNIQTFEEFKSVSGKCIKITIFGETDSLEFKNAYSTYCCYKIIIVFQNLAYLF